MSEEEEITWSESDPAFCDICGRGFNFCFVDGKTKAGPWALMCPLCHINNGVGFGTGKGQMFVLANNRKKWIKAKG